METKKFLDKIFRKSHSWSSVRFYESGIRKLEAFCSKHGKDPDAVISDIKGGRIDVYSFLDDFSSWMDSEGLRGKTQQDYLNAVKKFLKFHNIEIVGEKFREKVTVSTPEKSLDEIPTREELKQILVRCNPRLRALILVIATSGMRLAEALSLKAKDFNFKFQPVRVVIPARYVKTRQSRETFVTDEAAEAVKKCLVGSNTPNIEIFGFGKDMHMAEKKVIQMFRRVMRHFPELNEKIDGHRIHKIHLYSMRKFFFSNAVGIIGETPAHAIMGHSAYMDTYYRKPLEERGRDYLRCLPKLLIFSREDEDAELVTLRTMVESGVLDLSRPNVKNYLVGKLGIKDLEQRIAKMKYTGLDEDSLITKVLSDKLGLEPMRLTAFKPNGDPKKVIGEDELTVHLNQGWDYVSSLPSGKIIVRMDQVQP